jgi:hypothetical protein
MVDEVQLERRLTRLEDGQARLVENTQRIADQMTIANGRTRKNEEAIDAHAASHATDVTYARGVKDGRGALGKVDMAKLTGLFTLLSGIVVAASKAI